jgi:hypothetical protein
MRQSAEVRPLAAFTCRRGARHRSKAWPTRGRANRVRYLRIRRATDRPPFWGNGSDQGFPARRAARHAGRQRRRSAADWPLPCPAAQIPSRPREPHRRAASVVAKIPPGSGQSHAAMASPVAATGMARSRIDNVLPVAKSSTNKIPSRASERMRNSRKLACRRASNAARSSPLEGLRCRISRSTAVVPLREGANVASSKASIRACATVSALWGSSGSRFARASH